MGTRFVIASRTDAASHKRLPLRRQKDGRLFYRGLARCLPRYHLSGRVGRSRRCRVRVLTELSDAGVRIFPVEPILALLDGITDFAVFVCPRFNATWLEMKTAW
jgi:hypothetical protein